MGRKALEGYGPNSGKWGLLRWASWSMCTRWVVGPVSVLYDWLRDSISRWSWSSLVIYMVSSSSSQTAPYLGFAIQSQIFTNGQGTVLQVLQTLIFTMIWCWKGDRMAAFPLNIILLKINRFWLHSLWAQHLERWQFIRSMQLGGMLEPPSGKCVWESVFINLTLSLSLDHNVVNNYFLKAAGYF